MTFYDDMASTASSLLSQFGSVVTIYRESGQSVDPVTGEFTRFIVDTLKTKGITVAITQEDRNAFGDVQGNDRVMVLDGSQAPKEGDTVEVAGQGWSIVRILETNPAGTPLIYRVLIRK